MNISMVVPLVAFVLACDGNAQQVSSPGALPACEWCGADEAPDGLTAEAVLAGVDEPGERLTVRGVVLEADGVTPAAGVLVYAYHTNAAGIYPKRGDEQGNARRHGYLRGWLRTGADGRYEIRTIRPAAYPGRSEPAHIHITITPPGGEERWIDEVEFDDDPLLTPAQRRARENRGGSGIVRVQRAGDGTLEATRDIILGTARRAAGGSALRTVSNRVTAVSWRKPTDTLRVDAAASVVRWKGTKFRGLGSHEGIVKLAGGTLVLHAGRPSAGSFSIDMRTIQVTDIPKSDPVPRRRLTEHLRGDDFFQVARHPAASFRISSVRRATEGRFTIDGALTIRGVTKPISMTAQVVSCRGEELRVRSQLEIDRQRWGLDYRGSRLTNDLVDDIIHLDLLLVARAVRPAVSSGSAGPCNNMRTAGIRT